MPDGNASQITAATIMARVSPSSRGKRCPARADSRMYAAQAAPAVSASSTPMGSTVSAEDLSTSLMRSTPTAATRTARKSRRRRDRVAASSSGPTNSMVTATPIGRRVREA